MPYSKPALLSLAYYSLVVTKLENLVPEPDIRVPTYFGAGLSLLSGREPIQPEVPSADFLVQNRTAERSLEMFVGRDNSELLYTPHLCIRIVSYCGGLGISEKELLQGTCISPHTLCDTSARVTLQQTCHLADNALRLSADPALGLKVGQAGRPEDGGIAALASSMAGTFWDRARNHERYHRLLGQILVPHWAAEEKQQLCRFTPPGPLGHLLPFFVEESLCGLRESINQNHNITMTPTTVRLAYTAPAHHEQYQSYFRCPLTFNAANNELYFDFLALPERRFPGKAFNAALYQQMCDDMAQESGIVEQVKSLLIQHDADTTLDSIAGRLGITSRTLFRHLDEKGYSFRRLKNEVRLTRSQQLLHHTSIPVELVAQASGFRSVRRFREFFIKHTGQTPSAYRRAKH